jgi:hypothetical protein
MKICTRCKIEKNESEFPKNKYGVNGLNSLCKQCKKEYYENNKNKILNQKKDYHKENRDKILLSKKEYQINNKELLSEKKHRNYVENKDLILEKSKKYYDENKHRLKEKRKESGIKYREKNKEIIRKKIGIWVKNKKGTDPEYRLKNNIRCRFTESLKIKLENKVKPFFQYTGISYSDYIDHLKTSEFWESFCNGEKIHIDHIIPCSLYDFNDTNEIKKCWSPLNLRLLPAKENIIKSDKLYFDLIKKYNIEHLLPKNIK